MSRIQDIEVAEDFKITDKILGLSYEDGYKVVNILLSDILDLIFSNTVEAYISDTTAKNLLENTSNWDVGGSYIGVGITGTFKGQKHYNTNYYFEAVEDNLWIRLQRV